MTLEAVLAKIMGFWVCTWKTERKSSVFLQKINYDLFRNE